MNASAILRLLQPVLTAGGHPVALAGAYAINAYGMGRLTDDVDLVVPESARGALLTALEANGFETVWNTEGFSQHVHPTLGRLDLIYIEGTTEERFFGASRPVPFEGSTVLVPKREHLIAMKVKAIKSDPDRWFKDMEDIRYLLSLPGVDREEARRYFVNAGMEKDWDELEQRRR